MTNRVYSTERQRASVRLRVRFLEQAASQVEELAGVLGDNPSEALQESVGAELLRMADTAQALELTTIAKAARETRTRIATPDASTFFELFEAVRDSSSPARFPAIGLIQAPTGPSLAEYDDRVCEPLHGYPSVEALLADPGHLRLRAEVMPLGALAQTDRLGRLAFAYGPANDLDAHHRARQLGAEGYVPEPLVLAQVLSQVREGFYRLRRAQPRGVVLAADADWGTALAKAARANKLKVHGIDTQNHWIQALDLARPDLVVVQGQPDSGAAGLLNASVMGATPSMVVAPLDQASTWYQAGATWVVAPDQPVEALALRLAQAVVRCRHRSPPREPISGVMGRPTVLAAIDQHLSHVSRNRHVLAVAVLSAYGQADWGEPFAGERAFRRLATGLEASLRVYDCLGHLGGRSLVVAMPNCVATDCANRIDATLAGLLQALEADHQGHSLRVSVGVADTRRGFADVLLRADKQLHQALVTGERVVWQGGG